MNELMERVGTAELWLRMRDVLEKVHWGGRHVLITRFGRPMAVLVPFADYQELVSREEEYRDEGSGIAGCLVVTSDSLMPTLRRGPLFFPHLSLVLPRARAAGGGPEKEVKGGGVGR